MKIIFDTEKMRPGCPLIQAMMGGSIIAATRFDCGKWLLSPTVNMKLYEITEPQLEFLVEKVNRDRVDTP
jgi:hypothetical protein